MVRSYLKTKIILLFSIYEGSRSSQCSMTDIIMAVVCAILCGVVDIKDPLLLIGKSSPCSGGSGFRYMNGA